MDERRFKADLQKLHCAKEIVTFKKGGHFHPVKLTKATEKAMAKVKFAKLLSDRGR